MIGNSALCASVLALAISSSVSLAASAAMAPAGASPPASVPAAGAQRFIVKYRQNSVATRAQPAGDAVLAAAARGLSAGAAPVRLSTARHTGTGARVVHASRPLSPAEADTLLQQLRADPQVEYAQVDVLLHALGVPNDPALATHQWDMQETVGGIHAAPAWQVTRGEGVVVAVLDTGVLPHEDLVANLVPGYDMISDDVLDGDGRDADPTDPGTNAHGACPRPLTSSWHGTHVAGTVAAVGDNGIGVAGTAWGAQVQPVRVLGECGSGFISDIADGVLWAAGIAVDGAPVNTRPADVINMSLGANIACSDTPVLQEAIDRAVARGTSVVVAAGNSNRDVEHATPAGCNNVIAVAATDFNGMRTSYSNFGLKVALSAPGGDSAPVAAPMGGQIWSTADTGTTTANNDNALVALSGTSMAAPHVAGIVALMQSAVVGQGDQPLAPDRVLAVLRQSARPFPREQARPMGNGIADAARAVQLATGQEVPEPPPLALVNGVSLVGQGGEASLSRTYVLEVPAGATVLNLRTMGGTGDVSLYASQGRIPTVDDADHRSTRRGTAQTIVLSRPAAGTWYLRVVGETQYRGVSVLGLAR